ncbi:MAG TPA: methylated-DNA--[protein]-cysteine S-methyltransferase [Chlamydiales bacterium]
MPLAWHKTSEAIHYAVGDSSLDSILVAQSSRGLCAVFLGDSPKELERELKARFPNATLTKDKAKLNALLLSVTQFVDDPSLKTKFSMDERGTPFQKRVWRALREIPLGSTASYTDIAKKIDLPKAARAVAQACGANFLAPMTPCHRVIHKDGTLSGYRWGIERKRKLLDREIELKNS